MPDPTESATTPAFDIREVTTREYADSRIGDYAFGASPPPPRPDQQQAEDERWLRYLEPLRLYMAYDGGTPMAKAGVQPMTLNVRGRVVPMGGVGGVSTMPAGRRKGHVRALMTHAFARIREDGQPVSALYPFRESFYERLGYAGWTRPRYTTLHPADLQPLLRLDKPGAVEHMMIADGYDAWAAFLRDYQAQTHGFALRHPDNMVSERDENRTWLVLVREGGEVTGAMTYRITGYTQSLIARTFYARTAAAHYHLLDWVARHADQVKEARIRVAADAFPELWYRDLEAPTATNDEENWAAPMGRVIAIDGLSGIGAGDGEATVEVVDEFCPWNSGVWTLRGSGSLLEVTPGGTPSASITIQGLSALLFTGTDPDVFPFRGWGAVDAATATGLRTLFPPAAPFIHEEF
jgi:predicted acetyltransferase